MHKYFGFLGQVSKQGREPTAYRFALIETVNLKKYFKVNGGLLHAVDGVSIQIKEGATLGLVGESGCGKSTLGRLILRLIKPTGGEIRYGGEDILGLSKKEMLNYRKKMQIIFQDPFASLNPRMSVFELIAEPLIMNKVCTSKKEMMELVFDIMNMVGLAPRFINSYPHEMDGGRRQRVGIARGLALKPNVALLEVLMTFGLIVHEVSYSAAGDLAGDTLESVIGTGPYRLTEWKPTEIMVFESFDDY